MYLFILSNMRDQKIASFIHDKTRSAKRGLVVEISWHVSHNIKARRLKRPAEIVQAAYILFISRVTASLVPYKAETRPG